MREAVLQAAYFPYAFEAPLITAFLGVGRSVINCEYAVSLSCSIERYTSSILRTACTVHVNFPLENRRLSSSLSPEISSVYDVPFVMSLFMSGFFPLPFPLDISRR